MTDEVLVQIRERLATIEALLQRAGEDRVASAGKLTELAFRVAELEKFRWQLVGGSVALSVVSGLLGGIASAFIQLGAGG